MSISYDRPLLKPPAGSSLVLFFVSSAVMFLGGCTSIRPPTPTPALSTNAYGGTALQVVAAKVEGFGWTGEGEVFYSVEAGSGLRWYLFDPETGATRETLPLRPEVPAEVYDLLTEGGTVEVITTIVSPSGQRILYERRPEGYVRPSFETPIPDYYPPSELWFTEDAGRSRTMIEANFAYRCGIPDPMATWLRNETLVVGYCSPLMGLGTYFIVHLESMSFDDLVFFEPTGVEQILPLQSEVSHDERSLAFTDMALHLWVMPMENLRARLWQPLDPGYLVPLEDIVLSPQWSPDDRRIYYWRTPPYGPDADFYDQVLMRVDPETGSTEEVLSRQRVLAQMGSDAYWTLGFSFGYRPDWRLSPDGSYGLLRVVETRRTTPGLLLLSLEGP